MPEVAAAWIFQYDQDHYEIAEFVQEHGEVDWWDVTHHWKETDDWTGISVGDRVYFRRSGKRSGKESLPTGISAVGRVLSPVYQPPAVKRRVDVHFEWELKDTLTPSEVKDDPILGQKYALVPGGQGTNFPLTFAQAARLDELVTPRHQPFAPHALTIDSTYQLDERTRTLIPVVQRQGQPEFRNRLIQAYGGRCAITDCDAIDALEAAHISPYLGPKTNHVTNGLLLRADIHTLFDRGLLSIEEERMTVLLHADLKSTTYRSLDGTAIHLPSNPAERPDKGAVRHHRKLSGL